MSLILKGIDLPKHCEAVEVKFCISDIDVYRYTYVEHHREVSAVFTGEDLDNIIQIPKDHGRIGDLDELQKAIKTDIMGGLNYGYFIRNTPTILESEKDK